jgi:hypothetical protein
VVIKLVKELERGGGADQFTASDVDPQPAVLIIHSCTMKPGDIIENIIEHLKTLIPIAEAVSVVPVIGPKLKGSLEAALTLAEVAQVGLSARLSHSVLRTEMHLQTAHTNKEDMVSLAGLVSQWMTGLCEATDAARRGGADLSKIQGEINEVNRCVTELKHG